MTLLGLLGHAAVAAVLLTLAVVVVWFVVALMLGGRATYLAEDGEMWSMTPRLAPVAGSIAVTPSRGFVAWCIRRITRGPFAHAVIATGNGDEVVEADPHGARLNRASHYRCLVWLDFLTDGMTPTERAAAVAWAVEQTRPHVDEEGREVGPTPYSWLDDAYIGVVDVFGWAPLFMRERLASTDTLMCSQLCDEALRRGGRRIFLDDRPAGGVSPNDLARRDEELWHEHLAELAP